MPIKHTDQEIISAIENSGSIRQASINLGIDLSGLHKRRRRIEQRNKIEIKAPQSTDQYKHLQTAHIHPAKKDLGILNGTVIVFSDAHFWPGVYTTAFKGLLWAIRELKPNAVIANGDIFDGAGISRYPRIGWAKSPSVMEELKACTISM